MSNHDLDVLNLDLVYDDADMLPWAEYAIVDCLDGSLGIELRRVPINLDVVKEAALTSDRPGTASWLELWITPASSTRQNQ